MLKDTAAAPKAPPTEAKPTSSAQTPTSASKRKHMMLPHYKLTPRSELASAPGRLNVGGLNDAAEAAGRDMFVSKLGGVKKLVIEPSDSEQSALFNPAERARLRSGIATGGGSNVSASSSSVPGTPSSSYATMGYASTAGVGVGVGGNMLFSPGVFATPSYPRISTATGGSAMGGGGDIYASPALYPPATPSTSGVSPPVAIYTSPPSSSILTTGTSSLGGMIAPMVQTNPHAPTLSIPGCYTVPALSELRQKSPAELARLPEFTIGHAKYGTVSWKTPTDVRGLNLDKLVAFTQDSVEVYPETYYPHGSPADGVLNKTATVTIFNVSVWKLLGKEPISASSPDRVSPATSPADVGKRALTPHEVDQVISELRRQTDLFHGRFVSFSPEGNKWVFEVDHFTRYGLGGSNAVQPTSASSNMGGHLSATGTANSTAQSSPAHSPSQAKLLASSRNARSAAMLASRKTGKYDDDNAAAVDGEGDEEGDLDGSRDDDDSSSVRPLLAPGELGSYRPRKRSDSGGSVSTRHLTDEDEEEEVLHSLESGSRRSAEDLSGEDEEDEEEEYGEEEEEEVTLSDDNSQHQFDDEEGEYDSRSDFSHSDSISTFPHKRRYQKHQQHDHDDASVKSSLSRASRRSQRRYPATVPSSSSTTRDQYQRHSAASEVNRDGIESRTFLQQRQQQQQQRHHHQQQQEQQQHVRSTPYLAKQLGLNPRDMQQMKANFFPSESKFQSTKRPTTTPDSRAFGSTLAWDHQHTAKRFKSGEPVTEVKMQMPKAFAPRFPTFPTPSSKPLLEEHPHPKPFASMVQPKYLSMGEAATLSKASTQRTLKFTPVPYSNSLAKNASMFSIDPMLYQGRSTRVCWTPQGTLYCPTFTTVKHCAVHTSSTSVAASLLPSLQAHQKLSQLSYERPPSSEQEGAVNNAVQSISLPFLHLSDQWNAFVNQQIVIVTAQLEKVSRALASSVPFSGEKVPSSSSSFSTTTATTTAARVRSVLLEVHYKYKSELSTWKMFKALFGEPTLKDAIERFEGTAAEDHVTGLVRKHQLDAFLCELTIDEVKRELLEMGSESGAAKFGSPSEKHWKVLFTLLTGKRIREAVELAMSMGENRLALLVAQAVDPTTLHMDVRKQLQTWAKEGAIAASNLEPYKLAIFSILAGEIRVVASESRIPDWLRSFAMFFWYSGPNSFAQPLETTIDMYSALCTTPHSHLGHAEDNAMLSLASPSPSYARAFPSLAHKQQHDILYHMLQVYRDRWTSLESMLNPLANSPRILDFSLSWFLLTVCRSAHVGSIPALRSSEITVAFATQLEMAGMWTWSVYVLLSLPSSSSSQDECLIRIRAVKDVIFKHAEELENAATGVISQTSTPQVNEEAVAKLFHLSRGGNPIIGIGSSHHHQHNNSNIPTVWIYEALAQLYQYRGDWMNEVWARLKAEQWEEAHELVISRWATNVIIDFGADSSTWPLKFINALQLLETHSSINKTTMGGSLGSSSSASSEISNWIFGGNIFLTYHRLFSAVKDAQVAWQSSVDTVDARTLSQLNTEISDFAALVNGWTRSLQALVSSLTQQSSSSNSSSSSTRRDATMTTTKMMIDGRSGSSNGRIGGGFSGYGDDDDWYALSIGSPAGTSLRQRRLDLGSPSLLKQQLFCASELSSQLISSISTLKLLIACVESDISMPNHLSHHLVPLPPHEMIDSMEPLQQAFITPDQLASNLALLTSRYLDWRVSAT